MFLIKYYKIRTNIFHISRQELNFLTDDSLCTSAMIRHWSMWGRGGGSVSASKPTYHIARLLSRDKLCYHVIEMSNFTKWHFVLLVISCVSFGKWLYLEHYILLFSYLVVLYIFIAGHALECYVCTDQEGNRDKCLNTIKTCEHGQNSCLTEIKWGSKYHCRHFTRSVLLWGYVRCRACTCFSSVF